MDNERGSGEDITSFLLGVRVGHPGEALESFFVPFPKGGKREEKGAAGVAGAEAAERELGDVRTID